MNTRPGVVIVAAIVLVALLFAGFSPLVGTAAAEDPETSSIGAWGPGDEAVVAADDSCLNLRSAAGLDQDVENCLATGVAVTVLSEPVPANDYAWVEVQHWGEHTGWVASEYLEKADVDEPNEDEVAEGESDAEARLAVVEAALGERAFVATGGSCLNFREEPQLDAEILTCLLDKTELDVLGDLEAADGHVWVHVGNDEGDTAWVVADYLVFFDEEEGPERQVIGTSIEGRDVEAVTIGQGSRTILLVGGIHTGPEAETVELVKALLAHYSEDTAAELDDVTLVFVPKANPDGYVLDTRENARGVDLNRNWPASDWQEDAVHGETPTSGGTEPLSEPETRALYDFIMDLEPLFVLSYHGYASVVDDNGHGVAESLAGAYAAAAGYEHISDWTHYDVTGGFIEALAEIGIAAADVELATDDADAFERNLQGLLAVIEAAAALE